MKLIACVTRAGDYCVAMIGTYGLWAVADGFAREEIPESVPIMVG